MHDDFVHKQTHCYKTRAVRVVHFNLKRASFDFARLRHTSANCGRVVTMQLNSRLVASARLQLLKSDPKNNIDATNLILEIIYVRVYTPIGMYFYDLYVVLCFCVGNTSFRRSDTGAILIGDIITTNDETTNCFTPFLFESTRTHPLLARTHTRTLSYTRTYTRIVSVFSLAESVPKVCFQR